MTQTWIGAQSNIGRAEPIAGIRENAMQQSSSRIGERLLTKSWQKLVFRLVSASNLFAVGVGLYMMSGPLFHTADHLRQRGHDYAIVPFYVICAINLGFLIALAIGSFYLWALKARGLRLCFYVFFAELGYWFVAFQLPGSSRFSFFRGLSDSFAIGNMGIWIQFRTFYPLIALLLLGLGAGWRGFVPDPAEK
jgi:hypothetical protein